ncbi:MAG: co-chaperone DjlA, partial [Polyangiaceae bacterium]
GGLIGIGLSYLALRERLRRVGHQFVETTFSVMGALCKADGVVTRDEIEVVGQIFALLHLDPEQKEVAKAAFNRGKAADFDLDGAVGVFARVASPGSILFQLFLQLQLMAVAADGQVHPAEQAMLLRVARLLGLTERDLAQLEALLRSGAGAGSAAGGVSSPQRLADAYAVLGVTPDANDDEVKSVYRKLIRENHPDKLASKGLPPNMRAVAETRAREINAAYDLIKKTRGIA